MSPSGVGSLLRNLAVMASLPGAVISGDRDLDRNLVISIVSDDGLRSGDLLGDGVLLEVFEIPSSEKTTIFVGARLLYFFFFGENATRI